MITLSQLDLIIGAIGIVSSWFAIYALGECSGMIKGVDKCIDIHTQAFNDFRKIGDDLDD